MLQAIFLGPHRACSLGCKGFSGLLLVADSNSSAHGQASQQAEETSCMLSCRCPVTKGDSKKFLRVFQCLDKCVELLAPASDVSVSLNKGKIGN